MSIKIILSSDNIRADNRLFAIYILLEMNKGNKTIK